ncbi:MAG: dipeptide/oligopeptide/nickel ABC transporter ATP-binding protein [Pseudomonadota bacterium]|nr:dipeptide/oligopeptide/nickel ABC transporter ATP-binding protein [Pseudomonadota bacterium]
MLDVSNLSVSVAGKTLLRDVSFSVGAGEMLCIVGESGAGKSTLLKGLMGMMPCRFDSFQHWPKGRSHRQGDAAVQGLPACRWVMQDPLAALNPKRSLGQSICESLFEQHLPAADQRKAALAALEAVDLSADFYDRLPKEVSLGQAQRACLARALIAEPALIIFDEPLSALDALVQKKIALRMDQLRREKTITYIVVTHDLGFAAAYADHVLLLQNGRMNTLQRREDFFANPATPYANQLVNAAQTLGALDQMEAAR